MSCCGGNRAAQRNAYQTSSSMPNRSAALSSRTAASANQKPVSFEYTGMSAITVTGPATGSTYRFDRRGARLAIHSADAASLLAVPGLRPIG